MLGGGAVEQAEYFQRIANVISAHSDLVNRRRQSNKVLVDDCQIRRSFAEVVIRSDQS
jgi:hypothetical protein